jgi:hypothetical protein
MIIAQMQILLHAVDDRSATRVYAKVIERRLKV